MVINMADLFSFNALIGGVMIGGAVSLFLLFLGRVMGVSGMIGALLQPSGWRIWRALALVGLLISPWIYGYFFPLPTIEITDNPLLLIFAGLLVGAGSALASGCTSGHSICGIARLSPASLLVTVIFMVAGGLSLYIVKHILGV